MGAVFRPEDVGRSYRRIMENAVRDLSPDTKDNVIQLFNSWEGTSSRERLNKIMGPDKADELLKKIKDHDDSALTDEDRRSLKNILKDSLTFD